MLAIVMMACVVASNRSAFVVMSVSRVSDNWLRNMVARVGNHRLGDSVMTRVRDYWLGDMMT